jgi:DNA-binding NarL/FixJ family response regulator
VNTPIRLVLVDDHQMLLEALTLRLGSDPELEIVGTASNGDDGLRLVRELRPDLVTLDVDLPGRGSFDVAAEISARQKETRIIFLTSYLSDVFISQALRVRTHGYLLKGEGAGVLVDGIKRVHRGEICFSEEVVQRLTYDPSRKQYTVRSESRLVSLTGRQLEVLRHLARGQSVKEVARTMHLSEKSVDSHKYRIMHKLGIHDRVELARYAIREGLMLP